MERSLEPRQAANLPAWRSAEGAGRRAGWDARIPLALAVTSAILMLLVAFRDYGHLGSGAAALWLLGFIQVVFSRSVWARRLGWGALILGTVIGGAVMFALPPAP